MTRSSRFFLSAFLICFALGCNRQAASTAPASPEQTTDGSVQAKDASLQSGPALQPASASADSQPDPVPSSPQGAAAHGTWPVIAAFGDSLTAGYGADSGQSYPDYLQRDLDQLGYKYRVVNLGISGNTSKDGLDRLPDVIALHPALAVVEFGGNDGLRGVPVNVIQRNLDQIIQALQQAHIQVALAGITLPPNYGPDYIAQFNAMYTTLARKHNTPVLPFLLVNVYGVPGDIQPDGVHATGKGNKQVALNVLQLIQPLLKR